MKKIWCFIFTVLLFSMGINALAEKEPIPIEFKKAGGGQYIYCNNPENITEQDLSTDENPNSTYMMKNEGLKPDRYSVFFGFYNYTDFDVEADIEFAAKDDAVITIHSIGFYIPYGEEYWNCLGAWSDFMGINIRTMNEYRQFVPYQPARDQFPKKLKLSECNDWISNYIYNYDVIKPRTTFNMLVDFTIDEGEADVNFAALKHYGETGDRSHHNPNAARGAYRRDTSIKGIDSETLPMVQADLNIVIDEEDKDGENIMVGIKNQFHPEGNTAPHWMTNINPARDAYIFSKNVAVGSDMLSFQYTDDSKLQYYGRKVPASKRDNVWNFDIYHYDTTGYITGMRWKAENHIPNDYTAETMNLESIPNTDWQINLGNFGVTNRYKLTVTNNDSKERVLNYMLDTTFASNIIIIRDEDETMLNPYTLEKKNGYALAKGMIHAKVEDCILSIPVRPGETKTYLLDMILPTNCYGGMLNALKVDSYPYLKEEPVAEFPQYLYQKSFDRIFFNGENYMKWEDDTLYEYGKNKKWSKLELPDSAKEIFQHNSNNFRVVKTNSGYAARFSAWDTYKDYITIGENKNKVYFFDDSFNYLYSHTFAGYIYDMIFTDDTLFVRADRNYRSKDGKTFTAFGGIKETFPVIAGKELMMTMKDSDIYLKDQSGKTIKIAYEDIQPEQLYQAENMIYFIQSWKSSYTDSAPNVISVTEDGMHWTQLTLPDRFLEFKRAIRFNKKIYVETKYEIFQFDDIPKMEDDENAVTVILNQELLRFSASPEITQDRTMVPMRFFFEKLKADVKWNEKTQQITVKKGKTAIVFQIDSETALVNDKEVLLDAAPYIKNDKTFIPMRFLSETLGYSVTWDEDTKTASVTAPKTLTIQ